jgi:CheY-like chemotaxis protein
VPFGRDQYEVARRVEVARCGTRHRAGLGFDPGHPRCGCDSNGHADPARKLGLLRHHRRQLRPGLIICDYRLRDNEIGSAVIERLRNEYNDSIPGMLITGDTAPDRIKEAQASGYLLLHKPVANEVLHTAIARLMQMQPPAVAGAPGT